MIPSINAMKFVVHNLRHLQHMGARDAMIFERAGNEESALSLRLQADDFNQVAQMLEEQIKTRKPLTKKGKL